VYVANRGTSSLDAFTLSREGKLALLAGGSARITSLTRPAQAEFTADGKYLVVSDTGARSMLLYPVGDDGKLDVQAVKSASAPGPNIGFGVGGDAPPYVFVSNEFGPTSLFKIVDGGIEHVNDVPNAINESLPCWGTISADGRFGYTANAGTGNVTGYTTAGGTLALNSLGADAGAVTGTPVKSVDAGFSFASTIDIGFDSTSKWLYALMPQPGFGIVQFERMADGSLVFRGSVEVPSTAIGVAAL
jgi:hypothetical protein